MNAENKVVRFLMDEFTVNRLINARNDKTMNPNICNIIRDAGAWNFTADYGMRSEPMGTITASLVRATLKTLFGNTGWNEEDWSGAYVFGTTRAPERVDTPGSITCFRVGNTRVVAIPRTHVEAQTSRYYNYGFEPA